MIESKFPVEILKECNSVIGVFSAAFLGVQDIKYIHEAGIKDCLLVDRMGENLEQMKIKYGYDFYCGDAFDYLRRNEKKYDLVISDHWSSMDQYVWENREMFLNHANKYVLMTICYEQKKYNSVPEGDLYHRSDNFGGVYWHLTKL